MIKRGEFVVKGTLQNRSEEEILDQTARIVVGTINSEKMGLTPEKVDIETFINLFKASLSHLLSYMDAVYISIGTYLNTDSSAIYSDAMQIILDEIEAKMNTKFYFYHGIALWICKNDFYAVWLPQ